MGYYLWIAVILLFATLGWGGLRAGVAERSPSNFCFGIFLYAGAAVAGNLDAWWPLLVGGVVALTISKMIHLFFERDRSAPYTAVQRVDANASKETMGKLPSRNTSREQTPMHSVCPITSQEIIGLLVDRVGHSRAADLIEECLDLGMQQVPYQEDGPVWQLPTFEAGHHLRFSPDGKEDTVLEVLEKDGLVLQAGFHLPLPQPFFFLPKAKKRHGHLRQILETHYGIGRPIRSGAFRVIYYEGEATLAYLSRISGCGVSIFVRVGNRRFWG
jgi:hypothetical protein